MHTWRFFWFLSSLSKCELQLFHLPDQKASGTTPLIVYNMKPVNLETSPSTNKPSLTFQSQYLSLFWSSSFWKKSTYICILPALASHLGTILLSPSFPSSHPCSFLRCCTGILPLHLPLWPPLSQGPSSKQMVRSVRILQGAFTYKGARYKVRSACRRTSRDGVGTSVWT